MSALPPLPPRQRPAAGAVLSTLGSYPEGPVTAPRRELLERSGLSWTSWRETLGRLAPYRLVVAEKGSKDGREASYTLTPEGRAAAQELDAHPGAWAPEDRRPPDAHPTPRASRARSSLRLPLKAARNEEAAAEQATPGAHPDAHPVAGLTEEDAKRIGWWAFRFLLEAIGPALNAFKGEAPTAAPAAPCKSETRETRAETHVVHLDPATLASAINRPGHPELEAVARVLVAEGVKTEDEALEIGRHVLDSPTVRVPPALARSIARREAPLSDRDRQAARLAKDPPSRPAPKLDEVTLASIRSLESLAQAAERRNDLATAEKRRAEAARLRSGAA